MIAFKFILLVASVLLGYFLGYLFTETRFRLAKYDLFNMSAFLCRPCLSFHCTWVSSTFFSLLFKDWIMLVTGIIFAFVLWVGLKIDQRRKNKKSESIFDK